METTRQSDPGCPVWLKRRDLLKDAGPTQRGPPLGGRSRHAANFTDLAKPAKPAKGPQKQRKVKTTVQNNDADSFGREEEMEYDA